MAHFRPISVGTVAAICSSILLGMSSGVGPLRKLNSTLSQGRVNVAFLDTSGSGETSGGHDNGKRNNDSFTATAHGSALFATAAGSSDRRPTPQPGAGGSNSLKPKAPTNVTTNRHGVPDPETAALLITALFGLDMKGYCSQRAVCRLPPPAR